MYKYLRKCLQSFVDKCSRDTQRNIIRNETEFRLVLIVKWKGSFEMSELFKNYNKTNYLLNRIMKVNGNE